MPKSKPIPPTPPTDPVDEDDTEGHAFKWHVEEDGKGGQRLRQTWSPDDPRRAPPSLTGAPTPGKKDQARR